MHDIDKTFLIRAAWVLGSTIKILPHTYIRTASYHEHSSCITKHSLIRAWVGPWGSSDKILPHTYSYLKPLDLVLAATVFKDVPILTKSTVLGLSSQEYGHIKTGNLLLRRVDKPFSILFLR